MEHSAQKAHYERQGISIHSHISAIEKSKRKKNQIMVVPYNRLSCKGVGENCTVFIECCERMKCLKHSGLLKTGVCACIDNFKPGENNLTCEWDIPVMITVTLVVAGILVFSAFLLVIGCLVVQWRRQKKADSPN